MKMLYFAYPGDLETPTGGYGYDRRIIAGLRNSGWQVELEPLGDGFPFPDSGTLAVARQRLESLPSGGLVVVDGLAFGAMAAAAGALAGRLQLVALVHHPLCLENGLTAAQANDLRQSENSALAHVRHVIVTSPATKEQVAGLFDVAAEKVSVILPGTDVPELRPHPPSDTLRLLSVGTLVPRKGYDILLDALAGLKHMDWRLDVVGGQDADPQCASSLQAQATRLELSGRVQFHGAAPAGQLEAYYRNADIFVLASRYEGYGMAFAEAMAHGLPVIGSGEGAVRETLPEGAAIYCPAEDAVSLQTALEGLMNDPDRRIALAAAARKAAESFPDWQAASAQFAHILQEVSA